MYRTGTILACFACIMVVAIGKSPTLFAVGPNVFRLDAEETVSVVSFGLQKTIPVSVYLQDHPDGKKTYSKKQMMIEPYKAKIVKLKISSSELSDLKIIEENKVRYLKLVVQSKDAAFKFKRESLLLVQAASGHVFIQTDKPIYNPQQTVHIRVIPVDQQLNLTDIPIRLEILNPQGAIVERNDLEIDNGFISHIHKVIDRPLLGNWTIIASYGKDKKSNSSVQFEVREYLLPTFEVKIKPHRTNHILPTTQMIEGSVTAIYTFGKPVKGFVHLRFHLDFDGKLHTLPTLTKDLDENGQMYYSIYIQLLLEPLGIDGHPNGARLFVTADVTERATFHKETETDKSCMFVRSPYVLSLSRSSDYMKPGLPYVVRIDGRYFGGGPVEGLSVTITAEEKKANRVSRSKQENLHLDKAGQGKIQIDILKTSETIEITARTSADDLDDGGQYTTVRIVTAYYSPSKSYLVVRPSGDIAEVGKPLTLEMLATKMDDVSALNLLMISRGHVVYANTLNRDAGIVNTVNVEVTPEMVPSVRVVAYYIIDNNGRNAEVVADSQWIDVVDKCSEEVIISTNKASYEPDTQGLITLTGTPNTLVGLSMVDSAVFLLNDRHILSRKKMFKTLETFDMGCGPGGGKDAAGVFFESGLSVVTTANFVNTVRDTLECRNPAHNRKRRQAKTPKAELQKKLCCREGIVILNDTTCYERASELVNSTSYCRQVFFECCVKAAACRTQGKGCSGRGRSGLGVLDIPDIFDEVVEEGVMFRANFPESLLFENYQIGPAGEKVVEMTLPSSITKWVIQAISVSPNSGMCVSEKANATVFKSFFVDVRLPVKAVRGEQLEVKVIVYNYGEFRTKVHVYMYGVTGMCSEARAGEKTSRRVLSVPRGGVVSTSYPIIPLNVQDYEIKVEAHSAFGGDGVKKQLHVVAEGKHITEEFTVPLDPQNKLKGREPEPGVQNDGGFNKDGESYSRDVKIPKDVIDNTASCSAVITGSVMGHSIEAVITGLENMLQMPTGCGEQTVIRMAPTVYAMVYLTHTNPDKQGIEGNGYRFIEQGYNRELGFRKPDGSFAVWTNYPSSTWLTAFVLKVFCQAREFVDIDDNVITLGFEWLSKQQTADGQYKDPYKVHHREMIGAVKEGVTLTAFVLIALRECYEGKQGKAPGEVKAVQYLEKELDSLESPYALSLVTYALVLANSDLKEKANGMLEDKAFYDKDASTRYWSETKIGKKAPALAVETTGYALLSQLELGNVKYSHAIVNWLIQQRNSKGAFVSTQDTVIGLQAITSYSVETFSEDLDMVCDMKSNADGQFHKIVKLEQKDATVQQHVKHIPIGGKLLIHAKGTGVGQMHVKLDFNIPQEVDELCKFHLSVTCRDVKFVVNNRNCDVCGEECKEEDFGGFNEDDYYDALPEVLVPGARSGKEQAKIGKRRSRVGRQVPRIGGGVIDLDNAVVEDGGSKKVVCIHVCTSSLTGKDTGMSIIDVGLFTGLTAIEDDLEKLKTDEVVQNFETIGERVILYVEKIPSHDPHGDPLCIKFKARQDHAVGNVQPQTVKVYDYYEPQDAACTRFYRPQEQSGLYETLCEDGVCKCAEGHCTKKYTDEERWALRKNDLLKIACTKADYVYRVNVESIKEVKGIGLLQRKVTADLKTIIKPGADAFAREKEGVEFWIVHSCPEPQLEIGKDYLIMGKDGQISENNKMKYGLDDTAFVMEFYNKGNRKLRRADRVLGHRMELMQKDLDRGCPDK